MDFLTKEEDIVWDKRLKNALIKAIIAYILMMLCTAGIVYYWVHFSGVKFSW